MNISPIGEMFLTIFGIVAFVGMVMYGSWKAHQDGDLGLMLTTCFILMGLPIVVLVIAINI